MIKRILSKIPRKHTKAAEDSVSSNAPKKNKGASKKFSNVVNQVMSAPKSVTSSGNCPQLDENFLHVADLQLNGNLSSNLSEALPSLGDAPVSEKEVLFIKKLRKCCVEFDFTDPEKDVKEKEIKRQTLFELVDYMSSASEKFTEPVMQEVVHMVSSNIFREFHPQPRENKLIDGVDLEEEEPAIDPEWPHLQIVYEFFLKFITSTETDPKVAKRYIDQSFVLKLLGLFDSEDPREREYLKTILHRLYGKFMAQRQFIRKSINNIFYNFVFETEKHNGIAEFLEVLGSIINGFALPLKEEHKLFLTRTLIPLHKPKCLAMYHQQLSYCILQFVEKDCKLADTVIRGLLKYWPVTNSSKEVLFLNELEEVLEMTQSGEFQRCMVPLFQQVSHCLNSLHFQVAERALFLWNNAHVDNMIKLNRMVIWPIVFPSLEQNAQHHWNHAVHSLSLTVRKNFQDLDPDLFKACQIKFQGDEAKQKEVGKKREEMWKRLEEINGAKKHRPQ